MDTSNLAESSLSVTSLEDKNNQGSRTCAERTAWVVLVNTWARSRAVANERGLLVAYPVIDINVTLI